MSNIGSMSNSDLVTLITNLQGSVNNISQSFSNVQQTLSQVNQYDSAFNSRLNTVDTLNGVQDGEIATIQNLDNQYAQQIAQLQSLFPITNVSILDQSINESKILNLPSDLANLNSGLSALNATVQQNLMTEKADVLAVQTALTAQVAQEASDIQAQNSKWSLLLGSQTGTTSNPFQIAIDKLSSNQIADETAILNSSNNIASLQSDNSMNKANITSLQASNAVNQSNIQSLQSDNTTNKTNISNLQTFTNQINSGLTAQINKEANDIQQLGNQISTLSAQEASDYNNLNSNINAQISKEASDINAVNASIQTLNNTVVANYSTLNSALNSQVAKEVADVSLLTTNYNNLKTQEAQDITGLQNQITTNLNLFNNQVYAYNAEFIRDENNISSLQSDNTSNKAAINAIQTKQMADEAAIAVLQTDDTLSKASLLTINNSIIGIQNNLTADRTDINQNILDISNIKAYDVQNNVNLNAMNVNISNNTNSINVLNNTTIPALDNKYLFKAGDSMSGQLNVQNIDNSGNALNIGSSASVLNLGSSNQAKIINIGGVNDVVNVLGKTNYIETTNIQIKNKVLVLNEGEAGNLQSAGVGLYFRDNDLDNKGYIVVGPNGDEFDIKAPQNDNIFKIKEVPSDFYDLTNKLYVDAQDAILQNNINAITQSQTGLVAQVASVNNSVLAQIPFSKINAFPSDNTTVLYGDGVFRTPGNVQVNLANDNLVNCTVPDIVDYDNSSLIVNSKFVQRAVELNNNLLVNQYQPLINNNVSIKCKKLGTALNSDLDTVLQNIETSVYNVNSTVNSISASSLGLGNLNNTSDLNKPVSTLVQSALNLKQDISGMNKAAVGLGNVDNTSDLNKPLSTATINGLALKQNILSQASATVDGYLGKSDWATFNGKVDLSSVQSLSNKTLVAPIMSGNATAVNLAISGNLSVAGTDTENGTLNATNVNVSGYIKAPTMATADNSTNVATTAYVNSFVGVNALVYPSWVNFTPIINTYSSGSPPTLSNPQPVFTGGTVYTNGSRYIKIGKMLTIQMKLSGVTGSYNGNGTYLYTLPNNYVIDTTGMVLDPTNTGLQKPTKLGRGYLADYYYCYCIPWTSTQFAVMTVNTAYGEQYQSSGFGSIININSLDLDLTIPTTI